MSFILPYENGAIDQQSRIMRISQCPKAQLTAFMSPEIIYIRNTGLYSCPIISSFERNDLSLSKYGPNYWCQWISKDVITFGSCSGSIFVSKLDENLQLREPLILDIEAPIVGTFSAHGYLGICLDESKIVIIDIEGNVKTSLKFEKGFSKFKSISFTYPNTLTFILGGSPAVVYLSKDTIENRAQYLYKFEPETNAVIIAYNGSKSISANAYDDNSVKVISASSTSDMRIQICEPSNDQVIRLFWLRNGSTLFILYASGTITVYLADNGLKTSFTIPALQNLHDITFDLFGQQAFYSTFESIGRIHMVENHGYLFSSSITLLNGTNSQEIASIAPRNQNSIKLPEDLYPIRLVVNKGNDLYALASHKGFVIINNNTISRFVKYPVSNMCFVRNYLVVFKSCEEKYYGDVYDFNVKKLNTFSIDHMPLFLSSNQNVLGIGGLDKITFFVINKGSGIQLEPEVFGNTQVIQSKEIIRGLGVIENGDHYFVFQKNRLVVSLPDQLSVTKAARYIWAVDDINVCIASADGNTIVIPESNHPYSFDFNTAFSDSVFLYSIPSEMHFGGLDFLKMTFASYVLMHFCNNLDKSKDLYNALKNNQYVDTAYGEGFAVSFLNKKADIFVSMMQSVLSDRDLQQAITHTIAMLRREHLTELYGMDCVDWRRIIPLMNAEWAALVVSQLAPPVLDRLVPLAYADAGRAVALCSQRGSLVPALVLADAARVPFEENIADPELRSALRAMKDDEKRWGTERFREYARRVASAAEKRGCAVAEFTALFAAGDERYKEVRDSHPEIKEVLEEMQRRREQRRKSLEVVIDIPNDENVQ